MGKRVNYEEIIEWTAKQYRTLKKRFDEAGLKPVTKEGNRYFFD